MKKLLAMLMGCMLLTSALVSCGDKDESSSGEGTTKASAETTGEDEGTSEDTSEEATEEAADDTTESSTNEKETEEKTEASSAETASSDVKKPVTTAEMTVAEPAATAPEVDPSTLKGGNILGSWVMYEDDEEIELRFNADGNIDYVFDSTSLLSFRNGKVCFYEDENEPLDYEFDGKKLKILYNEGESDKTVDLLSLERVSGGNSASDINGKYKSISGEMLNILGNDDAHVEVTIDGEKTRMNYSGLFRYEVSGNKLTMYEKSVLGGEDESTVSTFGIEGNKMTILDEYGDTTVLTKK